MTRRFLPWSALPLVILGACSEADGPIAEVGINEIATAQVMGDWIEIMNVTAEPVVMGGWAIEMDGVTYTFADDETIAPNGYVMLQGLALADQGGIVDLMNPDGELVDTVDYPATEADEGFGRVPDATKNWQRLPQLTPGAPNR